MNFSNIPSKGDQLETSRFTFHDLEGSPWVEVKPATRRNRAYTNATLREASKVNAIQRQLEKGHLTVDHIEKLEALTRDRLARHVLVDMGGWQDDSGADVSFSEEAAVALMRALPEEMFGDLVQFVEDEGNFRAADA
jgi:hypothetical protein